MIEIRKATPADKDQVWAIIKEVISKGDTYAFAPDSSYDMMMGYWFGADRYTYVATDDGHVVGTFLLRDNQPGLGSHIANGSYMVSEKLPAKGSARHWVNTPSWKPSG